MSESTSFLPAIHGYSSTIFLAIHCLSERFGWLVKWLMLVQTSRTNSLFWFALRYPSWIPNSTEAENCKKSKQMNKFICRWRTVIFVTKKISINGNKLCIKEKKHNHTSMISIIYFHQTMYLSRKEIILLGTSVFMN